MDVNNILDSINLIAEKLFKAVEGQVYPTLDKLVIIGPDILKSQPLKYIFTENKINGIIIIANAFILFYLVYYIFTQLMSLFNGNKAENVYIFVIKLILVAIVVNNSYFVCKQILILFDGATSSVELFTKDIAKQEVTFSNLKEDIISIKDFMKNDLLSLDGIIKGVVSFGAVSILVNFSIRYVTVIFLLLISPFALVTFASEISSGIGRTWFKLLFTNLLIQIIVKLVIFIPLMYKDINSVMYKIILVGTIYILYKINNFTKDLISKITENTQIHNIFKGG